MERPKKLPHVEDSAIAEKTHACPRWNHLEIDDGALRPARLGRDGCGAEDDAGDEKRRFLVPSMPSKQERVQKQQDNRERHGG